MKVKRYDKAKIAREIEGIKTNGYPKEKEKGVERPFKHEVLDRFLELELAVADLQGIYDLKPTKHDRIG